MLAVRDGDVSSLGTLFERHHRTLFDFFVRLTRNRVVAEDLVQDVFFRILKYRRTYRNTSLFTTWMFHIARNARLDHVKKHRLEVQEPEVPMEIPGKEPLPTQELEKRQHDELLQRALGALPDEKRELLIMARYQEIKYEQIAEIFDCEVGTIKVRVHRALNELRDVYFKLSSEARPWNVKKSEASFRSI